MVAVELLAADEVFEVNVAASLDVAGIGVVVDLIGLDLHFTGFDERRAAKVAQRSLGFLGDGANADASGIRCAGLNGTNPLIGIGTDGLGLRRRRERGLEDLGP